MREELKVALEGNRKGGWRACEYGHQLVQAVFNGRRERPEVEDPRSALPVGTDTDAGSGMATALGHRR